MSNWPVQLKLVAFVCSNYFEIVKLLQLKLVFFCVDSSDINCVYFCFRLGHPEECASAVSFLVSDDASYMTGDSIIVAGRSPRL